MLILEIFEIQIPANIQMFEHVQSFSMRLKVNIPQENGFSVVETIEQTASHVRRYSLPQYSNFHSYDYVSHMNVANFCSK